MGDNAAVPAFVGRTEPLARLSAAYQAIAAKTLSTAPDVTGWAGLVLVTGEAGIGKTALLTRFAGQVAADGGSVVGVRAGRPIKPLRGGPGPRRCGRCLIEGTRWPKPPRPSWQQLCPSWPATRR